jgi:DNA-binding NarL/FixJ family response regulator
MEPPAVKIVIVEDDRRVREGLAALIDGTPGLQCAAKFGSMEDALAGMRGVSVDLFLLDIGLPGMSGIDGVPRLKEKHPGAPVVMLTIYGDDRRIFAALCAGACGYLLKNTPPVRLLESIREVLDGGSPMSPEVARRVVELVRKTAPPTQGVTQLTPHELRLLGLLVEGHSYKTAGAELHVSINTIRSYIRSIYEKLHVHSKSEAVAKALRHDLQ